MLVETDAATGPTISRQYETNIGAWTRRARLVFGVAVALVLVWRVAISVRATLAAGGVSAPPVTAVARGSTSLRHTERFTIEYRADCKVIRVAEPNAAESRRTVYQLVQRGHRPAVLEENAILVETPVRRAIVLATVYVPTFLKLGVPEVLVGATGVKSLNTPELVAQAERGALTEVSSGAPSMNADLNLEVIRALNPDLILTSHLGTQGDKLRESGFKVAEMSEWLETSPLGRAEWIKFVAAFLDREAVAEGVFSRIEERYRAQAARARAVTQRRCPSISESILTGVVSQSRSSTRRETDLVSS
jgi:iron complex transport system substrate-binding protein